MDWQEAKAEFEWDGSLRDVYILNADVGVWQKVIYNAPGKLDRGISYKAVSEPRRREQSWRHSETTTVPSSKPR
jgi:hypothetical protein